MSVNDAPTPYPSGGSATKPLERLMQFRVSHKAAAETSSIPDSLSTIEHLSVSSATHTRTLVLRAFKNSAQQTVQFQILNPANGETVTATTPEQAGGNFLVNPGDPLSTRNDLFKSAITRGSTELWNFANTTSVTHPMHVHLQHLQVLERQLFDVYGYLHTGVLSYLAPPEIITNPQDLHFDPGMSGWKNTVRTDPGYVTQILIKFNSTNTGEYVVHCHILEHKDNDMMRSFYVQ